MRWKNRFKGVDYLEKLAQSYSYSRKRAMEFAIRSDGIVRVFLPSRFDFIGGWSDTPPICYMQRSAVMNVALTYPSIEISVKPGTQFGFMYNGVVILDIKNEMPLVIKTLEFLGFDCSSYDSLPNLDIAVLSSIPKGSGLGGSSILIAGLLLGIFGYYLEEQDIENMFEDWSIVNYVMQVERNLGSCGGWQDQIGSLFHGLKLILSYPSEHDKYYVVSASTRMAEEFEKRCLLIDTCTHRKAFNLLQVIRGKYVSGDGLTREVLKTIAQNAVIGFRTFEAGDLANFAHIVSDSWNMVCEVLPGSRIELVDKIEQVLGGDLVGGKLGGAGGGGFYMAILRDHDPGLRVFSKSKLEEALGLDVIIPEFYFG